MSPPVRCAQANAIESIPKGWKPLDFEKFEKLPGWKQQQVLDAIALRPTCARGAGVDV